MAFSSLVLRHLTFEAERIGIQPPSILAGILEQSALLRENFWVPERDMFEIVERALRESKSSGLGLRLGSNGSFTAVGASGMLLSVAESFRQALRCMAHFRALSIDLDGITLKEVGPDLVFDLGSLDGPIQFQECMIEFVTSNLAHLLADFAGPDAKFTRVDFNYPAPVHAAAYAAVFGCELRFNQPSSSIVVNAVLADRVQMLSQPALAERLWQLSEEELMRWPQPRTIVDDVRDGLRVHWGARPPRIAAMARRLGLSERSLRRRLAEMKVDYRSLVAERQRGVASQMLRRQGVSVKEVAHGLGYYSPSAFYRAFKRWTGASPLEHRRADV